MSGPQTASPKRLPPVAALVRACRAPTAARALARAAVCTADSTAEPATVPSPDRAAGSAADDTAARVLFGLGEAAASAAVTIARAALRAPAPNALPKRTESITGSVAVLARLSKECLRLGRQVPARELVCPDPHLSFQVGLTCVRLSTCRSYTEVAHTNEER